jgi:hypothetical protein
MRRTAAVFALLLFAAHIPADDKKPDPVQPGDVLRVGPGAIPFPTFGIPLAPTSKDADAVLKVFRDSKRGGNLFEKYVKMADAADLPFLRPSVRVKVTAAADQAGNLPVEVIAGSNKGKTGWVAPELLTRAMPAPKDTPAATEAVRKKVFARYFQLLTESFQEARKEAKTGASRWDVEYDAASRMGRKMDREAKALKIDAQDFLPIVQQGLAAGWVGAWKEK